MNGIWYVLCKNGTFKRIISYYQQLEYGGTKFMWGWSDIAASWCRVFNLYAAVEIRK